MNQRFSFIGRFSFFQRKRGRPPKTKGEGPSPVANYTKHPQVNQPGLILTPAINNQVILNEQHMKVGLFKICQMKHNLSLP